MKKTTKTTKTTKTAAARITELKAVHAEALALALGARERGGWDPDAEEVTRDAARQLARAEKEAAAEAAAEVAREAEMRAEAARRPITGSLDVDAALTSWLNLGKAPLTPSGARRRAKAADVARAEILAELMRRAKGGR